MPLSASRTRWNELLTGIAGLLPAGPACILVDGYGAQPGMLADRLTDALNAAGRPCLRLPGVIADWNTAESGNPCIPTATIRLASGPHWRARQHWDMVIWVRCGDHGNGSKHEAENGASADAVFAAGLVVHLPDTEAGLRELARVTRRGGLLGLFHPSGRAALAARHGRALTQYEPLADGPLRQSTGATGGT